MRLAGNHLQQAVSQMLTVPAECLLHLSCLGLNPAVSSATAASVLGGASCGTRHTGEGVASVLKETRISEWVGA